MTTTRIVNRADLELAQLAGTGAKCVHGRLLDEPCRSCEEPATSNTPRFLPAELDPTR